MEWYYVDAQNEQVGPFDEDDMAAMIAGSKVAPETLVWRDGFPDWVPARSVPEFTMLFQDYGEQATMIGGMTFAQGGFQTDVQAPSYAVKSEDESAIGGSKARSGGPRQDGHQNPSQSPGFFGVVQGWFQKLFGRR